MAHRAGASSVHFRVWTVRPAQGRGVCSGIREGSAGRSAVMA